MSRYTRDEILHLRDSPLIVFHTPPLPEWISPESVSAPPTKSARSDRQILTRNTRTTEEVSTLQFPRSGKGERQESGTARDTRTTQDKVRSDRNEDGLEFVGRRSQRDRIDRHDSPLRTARDPKKPDDGGDNFATRRARKSELTATNRGGLRRNEVGDDRSSKSVNKSTDPEWATGAEAANDDDPIGKTVDDFERWKQSMKKNDGSGDNGLPPLPNENESHNAPLRIKDDEPPKDVKPPPGFAGVTPIPQDHSDEILAMSSVFGNSVSDNKLDKSTVSSLPPGFTPNTSFTQPGLASSSPAKAVGSSKFSKFFSQPTQAATANAPTKLANHTPDATTSSGGGLDFFSTLAAPKQSASKDDAEGFERILAMLSSQSAPTHHKQGPPPSSRLSHSTRQEQESYISRSPEAHRRGEVPPGAFSEQGRGGDSSLQYIANSFDRAQSFGPYSPDRQTLPSMRDHSTGANSIMRHHTQNQDFFSSLLTQSNAPASGTSYASTHDGYGSSLHSRDTPQAPNARRSPPMNRHQFDLQGNGSSRGPAYGSEAHHLQYLRQREQQQSVQRSQMPGHQQTSSRPRDEMDFLNQLMAEQRVNADPYQNTPYSAQHPFQQSQPPPGRGQSQGYVSGVGSRPGPGWNGQFEIDPRIPNGNSQYRN